MIEYHVEYHRNSFLMARVHELFQLFGRTIVFVDGKKERRVVAPTVIAFKFIYRHELNGIHTQSFDVIETVNDPLKSSLFGKIAHMQFVYHHAVERWPEEGLHFPGIGLFCGFEHRHNL